MNRRTLLFLLACFSLTQSFGQSYIDLFSFRYQNSPNNDYSLGVGEGVDIQEISAAFTLPIQFKNNDALIIGAAYNNLQLDQQFVPNLLPQQVLSSNFQSILLQIGLSKRLKDNLNLTLMVLPKIASDFEELSGEDFQVGGLVLFTKTKNERMKWKYGLYYSQEFFSPFFAPLIGWDWKMNEKWRFWALLPRGATLERKISERFNGGLKYSTPLVSYRFSSSEDLGAYRSGYLHQSYGGRVDAYLEAYLTKNVVIQGRVGHTVFRNFRVFTKDDQQGLNIWGIGFQERSEFQPNQYSKLKNGLVFELGLYFRYDLEQDKEK